MANDLAMHREQDDVGLRGSGATLVEALVGARPVIVDQKLFDDSLQVAGPKMTRVLRHT